MKSLSWLLPILICGIVHAQEPAQTEASAPSPAAEAAVEEAKPLEALPETAPETKPEEKQAALEKKIKINDLTSGDKIKEAIGIETLASIPAPVLAKDSDSKAVTVIKLGAAEKCDGCAKMKLFRAEKEIGVYALSGISVPKNKKQPVVEIELKVTGKEELTMTAKAVNKTDKIEWVDPASIEAKKTEEAAPSPAEISKTSLDEK